MSSVSRLPRRARRLPAAGWRPVRSPARPLAPRPASRARWALVLAGLLVALCALVACAPAAHADPPPPPPGGLDPTTSAIIIRNGSTTSFQAGDQVLVTISDWRDPSGEGPSTVTLVPWPYPQLTGQGNPDLPISLGYSVAIWQDPMTFTLYTTLPGDVSPGLYSVEVHGATTTAQTQAFYLTPPAASLQRTTSRWVLGLAPGGLADAGVVGLLATLSAGLFLLGAAALQVVGFRRRRISLPAAPPWEETS